MGGGSGAGMLLPGAAGYALWVKTWPNASTRFSYQTGTQPQPQPQPWAAQLEGGSSRTPKGYGFDSQAGHLPSGVGLLPAGEDKEK